MARSLRHATLTAAAAGLLGACTTLPYAPDDALRAADLAVARADESRVADYDAIDLRNARDKLAAAREAARSAEAMRDRSAARKARWLAEESRADAELASARAQAAKLQAVALRFQRELDAMPAPPPAALPTTSPDSAEPGLTPPAAPVEPRSTP